MKQTTLVSSKPKSVHIVIYNKGGSLSVKIVNGEGPTSPFVGEESSDPTSQSIKTDFI